LGHKKFSEPDLRGSVVDAKTKQLLQGVTVYGFYATSGGGALAGGSKFGEHVRSFEAETDANGMFYIAPWDTGEKKISGKAGSKFPAIAMCKPGYDFWHSGYESIKGWSPTSTVPGSDYTLKDNIYDWVKFPHELTQSPASVIATWRLITVAYKR
jgi:hypothetical protein